MRQIQILLFATCLLLASAASAATITTYTPAAAGTGSNLGYTHAGVGSGSIGGTTFTDSEFVIYAEASFSNWVILDDGFAIEHYSANITIEGLGRFDFLIPTRTFVNNSNSTVGFSRSVNGGTEGLDLFNGPTDSLFSTWNLFGTIGTFVGDGSLLQWTSGNDDVLTSGGILTMLTSDFSGAEFSAQVIPVPAAIWLSLSALAGLGFLRASPKRNS